MITTNWTLKSRICERYRTQADFSQENGLDPTFVSKIINGRRQLSESQKLQWAKWLSSDVDELWVNEKPKPKLIVRRK